MNDEWYWMMKRILNDHNVSWGIGKGLALECATVLMGSDQNISLCCGTQRNWVELMRYRMILIDNEWYVIHRMTLNDL